MVQHSVKKRVKEFFSSHSGILRDITICGIGFVSIAWIILSGRWIQGLDGDTVPQTYSLFVQAIYSLKNGELPLWGSSLWGGMPWFSNPITQAFYPINWLLGAVFYDTETGLVSYKMIAWNQIIHLTIFYVGIYALCRRFSLSRTASVIAAFISVLNMSMMNAAIMTWLITLGGISYAPLILCCAIGIIDAKNELDSLQNAIWLGVLFGFQALLSVSSMLVINAVVFGILCLFRIVEMKATKNWKPFPRYIKHVGISVAIAVLLSAGVLLGMIVFSSNMARYIDGRGYIFPGESLTYYEFSHLYNEISSLQQLFKGNSNYSQTSIALIGIVFLIYGIASKPQDYKKKFILFSFFLTLLYSFGIVFTEIAYWIPGVNTLREPYLYSPIVMIFAGPLIALGVERIRMYLKSHVEISNYRIVGFLLCFLLLSNVVDPNHVSLIHRILAVLLLGIVLLITFAENIRKKLQNKIKLSAILCICIALCFALEFCEFYTTFQRGTLTVEDATQRVEEYALDTQKELSVYYENDPSVRITAWLSDSFASNMSVVLQFNESAGYINPMYDKSIQTYTNVDLLTWCQMQNIKYILHEQGTEHTAFFETSYPSFTAVGTVSVYPSYESSQKKDLTVYDTGVSLGSAWFVSDINYYDSSVSHQELLAQISRSNLSKTAFVNLKDNKGNVLEEISSADGINQVECIKYGDNSVVYHVNTSSKQLLVTTETNYPGWNVYVDGKKADIIDVNYMKRGVVVDAGFHTVEFKFEPWEAKVGIGCGVIGGCTVIALMVYIQIKKKQSKNCVKNIEEKIKEGSK